MQYNVFKIEMLCLYLTMLQLFRILACCAYYFPTTMALMYCYGSGFHVSKARSKCSDEPVRPNGVPTPCSKTAHIEHEAVVSFKLKY